MTPYWAMLSGRFRVLLQYRAAALAGFGTQLFFGYVLVMGYRAFYAAANTPQPMTLEEMITYIWLGQALLGLLPWAADPTIVALVRTGGVAYELLRPVDLYWFWYSRAIAQRTAPTLLRSVPMFVLAFLFLGMRLPPSLASGMAWAAATFCAVLLASAISALTGITLLWTLSGEGLGTLIPAMVTLLSGMLVPIPLLPEWAQPVLNALPFRGVIDIPFRLYLGHIAPTQALPMLALQLAWTAAIILFSRWLLRRGLRRLVVQGG
jgi:ABC-2 type transport system permease protein